MAAGMIFPCYHPTFFHNLNTQSSATKPYNMAGILIFELLFINLNFTGLREKTAAF
jgi:hypothetical protein